MIKAAEKIILPPVDHLASHYYLKNFQQGLLQSPPEIQLGFPM